MASALLKNASHAGVQNDLGSLMRYWRGIRGKSQLDVSMDTGISQRHISFIESGRSNPSRQALIHIAQALDIPLRERNVLLQASGYAPIYSESSLEAPEMRSLQKALSRMLHQHAPFPAIVMDRYWNVLMTNDHAPRFFNGFIDMSARAEPRNILHLIFDPDGLRPFMVNWEQTARSLIQRVHRESVGRVVDEKTGQLLRALHAYPDVKAEWVAPHPHAIAPHAPVIPLSFAKDGVVMNYFSMVATVGTPQTISAQEIRIECMFPADDDTEAKHMQILGD
ncbi:helix-turn-helix domain-containing protein [Dyella flava]|uniref:Helix-turn-helix transcriptional regulator n=1 Tax=Dyella flava TaxID=1920170 RepID=A0ABS2K199_9GAMM|nr:helix-turn-helix transcriptional regulator [Dyella flava]MBM7124512.1 helix-turn-helix transcriptional regulator [Dyella flava]GLQ51822.1 transcriptional regulator [Dyella flava]